MRIQACAGIVAACIFMPAYALHPEASYCLTGKRPVTLWLQEASTPESQAQGLMHRTSLKPYDGMLFNFGDARIVQMWMKNTPLALDMLFIDKRGKLVQKAEGTVPFSETIIGSRVAVTTVIELEAGRAKNEGFDVGAQLRKGSCDTDAADQ